MEQLRNINELLFNVKKKLSDSDSYSDIEPASYYE